MNLNNDISFAGYVIYASAELFPRNEKKKRKPESQIADYIMCLIRVHVIHDGAASQPSQEEQKKLSNQHVAESN